MMGVYIKGMEMPEEGNWRSIRIYPDGTIGRPIGFGDYALVDGAKAVPVPPHRRLIDADALMDALPDDFLIPSAAAKVIERTIIPASVTDINVGSKSADREEQIDGK